ncbi:hypothetical protein YC2023_058935 [Brassica napus]|nr:unnamed protein product [Brassica napus]
MAVCFVLGLILTAVLIVVFFSPAELPHVTSLSPPSTASETKPINFTVYLAPVTTATELRKELAPYSFEEFDVKLDTFIKWRFGSSSSKSVRVSCNEVPVGLVLTAPGHGMMIGPARMCKVF